jgi:hypothetical protein
MLSIRSARWPDDLRLLAQRETSFTRDRLFRLPGGEGRGHGKSTAARVDLVLSDRRDGREHARTGRCDVL